MTKSNILEQKKQKLEAKKNKLMQLKSHVKVIERKTRTRRLIECGGLVTKAGLEDLESNTFLGGLLHLKQLITDPKVEEEFAHKGGVAFARENQNKSPVIVKFDEKPDEETRAKMRELGLKWNAIRGEWQGYVNVRDLSSFIDNHRIHLIHNENIEIL